MTVSFPQTAAKPQRLFLHSQYTVNRSRKQAFLTIFNYCAKQFKSFHTVCQGTLYHFGQVRFISHGSAVETLFRNDFSI